MKLNQKFWDALEPNVRGLILHVARHHSERNMCYAAGYIRGAHEFGGLPYDHYKFLLTVLGDEGANANWRDVVRGFK